MRADQDPFGWPSGGSALPRPAGWTGQRLPVWLKVSMGWVALLALGMAAAAAWSSWTGQPATGVPLAAGAIYLGHVVGLATRFWWTPRRSSQTGTLTAAPAGTKGVRFGYSAWSYYWLTAVLVMTELAALALTVALAMSATVVGVVTAVVIGVLVLVVGWFLVTMLRLAPGNLILSPSGVYHRSLTSTHFIPWDAIVASPPNGSAPRSSLSEHSRQPTPGSAATWADSARGRCNSCRSWSSAPPGWPPTRPPSTMRCPSTTPTRSCGPSWPHLLPWTGSATAEQSGWSSRNAQALGVLCHWQERYGAELVTRTVDQVELPVARPPGIRPPPPAAGGWLPRAGRSAGISRQPRLPDAAFLVVPPAVFNPLAQQPLHRHQVGTRWDVEGDDPVLLHPLAVHTQRREGIQHRLPAPGQRTFPERDHAHGSVSED
jgi:hypothetical protein